MSKKARIIAALSAPVIGSLAFLGVGMAQSAPAGASAPIISMSGDDLIIQLPGIYIVIS
ncbi:MAG TPA: hypothetical protein VNG12_24240 [Acidimicrobiales bacterium]|nr:hypothetical protein [Acidimicrobiales bacterium]